MENASRLKRFFTCSQLSVEVRERPKCPQSRHEAVFTAASNDKLRYAGAASSHGFPRHCKTGWTTFDPIIGSLSALVRGRAGTKYSTLYVVQLKHCRHAVAMFFQKFFKLSVPPKSVVKFVESTIRMSPARWLFGGSQSRQLNSVFPAKVKG